MPAFADTNIFLHYLLRYDEKNARRCYQLLASAEAGREELTSSSMVVAELVWFLERPPSRLSAESIRNRLVPILELPALRLPEKELLLAALELHAESPLNFVDAYNTLLMQKRRITRIYSYDTDFDGVPGVERVEP